MSFEIVMLNAIVAQGRAVTFYVSARQTLYITAASSAKVVVSDNPRLMFHALGLYVYGRTS